jgi:N-acetyl-gamma-glutamyl-phosphate reductase common form
VSTPKARIGIVGVTGYVGSECVRWLLGHPNVEIAAVVARNRAEMPLGTAVPALEGLSDLRCEDFDAQRLAALDAVILATPHSVSKEYVPPLEQAGAKLILEMSNDHRLDPSWAYGQVEWNGEAVAKSKRIAVPGCFATAVEMAVAPLVNAGVVRGNVHVAAATGSTGSGADPSPGTHHPERFTNFRAYKVLSHQHMPEIHMLLDVVAQRADAASTRVHMVPLSAPLDRGIFATCFVPVDERADVDGIFRKAYSGNRLVRLRKDTPDLRHVRATAFTDLSVHREGDVAVVLVAIDNLGKGASAQAVQCLNLVLGLPVETGLLIPPATP